MKKARRTTHRSSSGKKLLAKRDKSGKFRDIQTWKGSSSRDQRKKHTKSDRAR